MTGGAAAIVPQTKATATIANAFRVIATIHIIFSLLRGEQKRLARQAIPRGQEMHGNSQFPKSGETCDKLVFAQEKKKVMTKLPPRLDKVGCSPRCCAVLHSRLPRAVKPIPNHLSMPRVVADLRQPAAHMLSACKHHSIRLQMWDIRQRATPRFSMRKRPSM